MRKAAGEGGLAGVLTELGCTMYSLDEWTDIAVPPERMSQSALLQHLHSGGGAGTQQQDAERKRREAESKQRCLSPQQQKQADWEYRRRLEQGDTSSPVRKIPADSPLAKLAAKAGYTNPPGGADANLPSPAPPVRPVPTPGAAAGTGSGGAGQPPQPKAATAGPSKKQQLLIATTSTPEVQTVSIRERCGDVIREHGSDEGTTPHVERFVNLALLQIKGCRFSACELAEVMTEVLGLVRYKKMLYGYKNLGKLLTKLGCTQVSPEYGGLYIAKPPNNTTSG
eukprot:TRINITY_DN31321_c0_g1_i1.p1 TRINITY_DN31321_c0_g1~~TRINITY_DN31321_c0_g1_i1.p1  ORF type:complete len:320 (+),score=84.65 TRINITY_DN31321_c0_g1_i1:115-960(+)